MRLTVLEEGQERLQEAIEVNDPLKYRGYWFYQSTYGRVAPRPGEEWVDLAVFPEGIVLSLALGERKRIEGTGDEVEFLRFEPDFVMDADRRVSSRSSEIRNPAAQIRVYRDGEPHYRQWVFAEFPHVHVPQDVTHLFELRRFASREFTGLQVAYDRGVPVVWVGCGLLVTGLVLSFTVRHRRVWIRVEADGRGSRMTLAAGSRGGLRRFEQSIDELVRSLRPRPSAGEGSHL
jgi:cytochrome c biogenesis protein